jgi:hypothetical protein
LVTSLKGLDGANLALILYQYFAAGRQADALSGIGIVAATTLIVPSRADQSTPSPGDIVFQCEHCATSLVVDPAAAGHILSCSRCGKRIHVPGTPSAPRPKENASPNNRLEELKRCLAENEAQRTEVIGHINQLNIQLHRWRLRLQKLDERRGNLQTEIEREAACHHPAQSGTV